MKVFENDKNYIKIISDELLEIRVKTTSRISFINKASIINFDSLDYSTAQETKYFIFYLHSLGGNNTNYVETHELSKEDCNIVSDMLRQWYGGVKESNTYIYEEIQFPSSTDFITNRGFYVDFNIQEFINNNNTCDWTTTDVLSIPKDKIEYYRRAAEQRIVICWIDDNTMILTFDNKEDYEWSYKKLTSVLNDIKFKIKKSKIDGGNMGEIIL